MLNGLDLFSVDLYSEPCYITTMRGWKGHKRGQHPCWKGGKYIDRDSYVRVYAPDHRWPRKGGYILEHRMIVENLLGRALERSECVHHIDHNRQNNHPLNLEVISRSNHSKLHRKIDVIKFKRDKLGRFVSCGYT